MVGVCVCGVLVLVGCVWVWVCGVCVKNAFRMFVMSCWLNDAANLPIFSIYLCINKRQQHNCNFIHVINGNIMMMPDISMRNRVKN